MQLVRIGMVLLAAAAVVGQYLQERYRLTIIQKLPGPEARRRYEEQRRRGEKGMIALAVVSALVGLLAAADLVLGGRLGR